MGNRITGYDIILGLALGFGAIVVLSLGNARSDTRMGGNTVINEHIEAQKGGITAPTPAVVTAIKEQSQEDRVGIAIALYDSAKESYKPTYIPSKTVLTEKEQALLNQHLLNQYENGITPPNAETLTVMRLLTSEEKNGYIYALKAEYQRGLGDRK